MSRLSHPEDVLIYLAEAGEALTLAHREASEEEFDRKNLTGAVRDLIFGLNTAVEALRQMIEEQRPAHDPTEQGDWP